MKYSRGTEVFIQWRDPDSRQVYGLSFASSDAADGFQQWLDYATNPSSAAAAAPSRNASVATPAPASSSSSSGESHYQRPKPQAATSDQQRTNDGPDVDSHQQSVYCIQTVNHKKRDILFLTITLANLNNRFLQFLYHFNRE